MNIPTAEEFIFDYSLNDEIDNLSKQSKDIINTKLVAFTKLHVEAALKAAAENAILTEADEGSEEVDEDSILNAYPLTNIA